MEDTCTTNFKILCKGQDIVDLFASWSNVNRVQLNIAKCKELCISIFKTDNDFSLTVGESTINPLTPVPPVTARDEAWPFFLF